MWYLGNIWINEDYIKHTNISWKRFRLDYWFSYISYHYYFKVQSFGWQHLYWITKRIRPSKKRFVRYLHNVNHDPAKMRKIVKLLGDELDIEEIKFLVNTKIFTKWKKRTLLTSAFFVMNLFVKKILERKTCWFIINRRKKQKHDVLIKYFNTFMYDHTLFCG